MFQIIFNPKRAERHPFEMMIIGFFYSSLSLILGAWIFPEYSSLVMVFFTVISCLYVVQGAIRIEEEKELDVKSEKWVLREHYKALSFFLFLFLGFVFAFAFWSFILPSEKVSFLFSLQESVVERIKSMIATGNYTGEAAFFTVLLNNLKVMLISLVFAFFYGAGAIFVLAWNASVMGFVIGDLAKNTFGLMALPIAFTKYFLHGIPEMFAYLTTALAGGIIYIAILRGDFFKPGRAKRLLIDVIVLIGASILLLIIAALTEIYISSFI
jgi:uncharacterized membrane protein SpoIIM required for sporulation